MSLYKIANIYVEMNPKYDRTLKQSTIYRTDDKVNPDIILSEENLPSFEEFQKKNPHLSLDEIEYILYGSKFYNELINHNGFLLHSSCVVVDNHAYLFSAPSGTGKSTHTQLYLKVFKDRARILNDDKPAIVIDGDKVMAYGTPFSGKTDLNLNEAYPIKGICFIERDTTNHIEEMPSIKSIYSIYDQTLRPTDEYRAELLLGYIGKVVENVPIFRLYCNMEDEAALLSFNKMNEKK